MGIFSVLFENQRQDVIEGERIDKFVRKSRTTRMKCVLLIKNWKDQLASLQNEIGLYARDYTKIKETVPTLMKLHHTKSGNVLHDLKTIQETMEWCISKLLKGEQPSKGRKIDTFETFCVNYRFVREAYKQEQTGVRNKHSKRMTKRMHQEADVVEGELLTGRWPAQLEGKVRGLVEETILDLYDFRNHLEQFWERTEDEGYMRNLRGFAHHILFGLIPREGVQMFAMGWLDDLRVQTLSWKNWNGVIKVQHKLRWRHSQKFDNILGNWSIDYCDTTTRWKDLKKELIHEGEKK